MLLINLTDVDRKLACFESHCCTGRLEESLHRRCHTRLWSADGRQGISEPRVSTSVSVSATVRSASGTAWNWSEWGPRHSGAVHWYSAAV